MRAVILAAGRGTRISRYLSGNPKCTVDIGGIPLIEYTVQTLNKKGIKDIAIVLGYEGGIIKDTLKNYDITYYENPFFDVTNSIASIWFAKEFFAKEEDYVVMNGDVFMEESLFDKILAEKKSPVMFADGTRKENADYKFYYENEKLIKYGKELTGADISGEYIGIGKFGSDFKGIFIEKLCDMIEKQQHSVWWENVIYSMSDKTDVFVSEINDKFWAEVDYIEDYERILEYRKTGKDVR